MPVPVIAVTALKLGATLLDYFKEKPNPNDWVGWASAGDAKHWILNDGLSKENEAMNVFNYVKKHGWNGFNTDAYGVGNVLPSDIVSKFERAGMKKEGVILASDYTRYINEVEGRVLHANNVITDGFPQAVLSGSNTPSGSNSNNNILLYILGGLVLFWVILKRK